MAKLNFSTMVGPASWFKPYSVDPDFSHFVFQPSNEDTSTRRTYELVVFMIEKGNPEPISIDPPWSAVGTKPFGKRINMGNLVINKSTLKKIFDKNDAFDWLGFIPQKAGEVKFEKYVSYDVGPTNEDGDPKQFVTRFSVMVNPSPPAH